MGRNKAKQGHKWIMAFQSYRMESCLFIFFWDLQNPNLMVLTTASLIPSLGGGRAEKKCDLQQTNALSKCEGFEGNVMNIDKTYCPSTSLHCI